MINRMKWEEVYELWQTGELDFPEALSAPVTPELVAVDYKREGYIYGYDWLCAEEVQERKQLAAKDPIEFLYFTKPSNKGTIKTVQMLAEAEDAEERAAVWIAATAFELKDSRSVRSFSPEAYMLNSAACTFLQERYNFLWHHAMRKLVPEIMIPYTVLNSIKCDGAETVMGLIQTNVMLIKGSYTPLLYSSLNENDPEFEDIVAEHRLHT